MNLSTLPSLARQGRAEYLPSRYISVTIIYITSIEVKQTRLLY